MSTADLLQSLPASTLPLSATVDIVQFLAGGKPAIRTHIRHPANPDNIMNWCQKFGFTFASDMDGFVCIACEESMPNLILSIDQSATPHEQELGLLLGYPSCCCSFVGSIGEGNIDACCEIMRYWHFVEPYSLINPSGYLQGEALICHLPCSQTCEASLKLARTALKFVLSNTEQPSLRTMSSWIYRNHLHLLV